jgi:uncharacterized protein YlxW (UPF0749 family)
LTAIAKSIHTTQKTESKLDKEIIQESDSVKLVKEKIQSLDHEVCSLQDQVKSSKNINFFYKIFFSKFFKIIFFRFH